MIGIDIIDLSCSFSQTRHSLDDYKNKILCKSEFPYCNSFSNLEYLWAIKESAYKCHYKKSGKSFLNPKKILITDLDWTLCTFNVIIEDLSYLGSFHATDEYIYSICFDNTRDTKDVRVFIGSDMSHFNKDEVDFYSQKSKINASFQHHSMGFAQGLILGNNQFAYSRSHHGSYYISAITPYSHN